MRDTQSSPGFHEGKPGEHVLLFRLGYHLKNCQMPMTNRAMMMTGSTQVI